MQGVLLLLQRMLYKYRYVCHVFIGVTSYTAMLGRCRPRSVINGIIKEAYERPPASSLTSVG